MRLAAITLVTFKTQPIYRGDLCPFSQYPISIKVMNNGKKLLRTLSKNRMIVFTPTGPPVAAFINPLKIALPK
ncbi:hypothetical protein QWZ13_13005 [Reinekea marina]|uniref:hypothetical protein n=1 Tax=Reinekea marina TaxID=1310421 RepID=UPI0025B5F572|nr:hypothetical protein [Reinekea marina]MDN3649832.1 hypothetical protein [Reinekea marina]